MSWIWTWVSLALVTAVVLLARRMRRADNQRVHLEARLASVLEGFDAGLSVWDGAGRLIGFNRRFREFYADAPLKPGVVFEDLIRYTANRGLVDIANDDVERWISEHVERFGQSSHEVLRTSDRKWVDIYSRTSGAGEVLLLYTDTTNVCETEATLSDRSDQLERQTRDGELVADVVVAVSGLDPLESVTGRVIELVCAWSGWPVGCAYRVTMTDGVPVLGPVLAWYETEGTTAPITDLRSVVEGATRREGGRERPAGTANATRHLGSERVGGPRRRRCFPYVDVWHSRCLRRAGRPGRCGSNRSRVLVPRTADPRSHRYSCPRNGCQGGRVVACRSTGCLRI